ncbi:hypothetical protein EA709_17220 [Acinetobacter baumannii]|uniref:hypothetical protein n=1 Tax=Acinetobacter baumannii TaxID=470 RepID=UPI0002BA9DCE|nr:hypothetical protein [Acinetobacter baumannii]RSQ24030.1 hypothetical protein EA709_17220 [Acinetobacter baumannii]
MTDLNKLRSEFENLPEIAEILNEEKSHFNGDFYDLPFNSCAESFINGAWFGWQEKAKAQAVPEWISAEVGSPIKFGTRVKIKRKSWDEEDNLIFVESEATYDKDSDFCELSNRSYEYETWFDHELNRYLDEDELTHWAPLDKSESGAEG